MKKMNKGMVGLFLLVCILVQTGCSLQTKENTKDESKVVIAVSIVPEQTFVEAVCGELAEVVTLIPPGYSPENYEPTPELMEKFSDASLYFAIGVPAEETNIIPNIVGDTVLISLQDEVASVYEERMFESGERDPHIWLSPKRVQVMIQVIVRELSKLDPENEETYKINGDAYIAKLDQLDQDIKNALVGVQNKAFIVYHPAFGYLAEDYGLMMYALEEEGKEATVAHLQEMIDFAKAENIKAIFYQDEIDSSQSEAYAEEIGGKTIQLSPLAANYIENLEAMAATMAEAME